MIDNKKIAILFSGLSLNNTPKIQLLIDKLVEDDYSVNLYGIVRTANKDQLEKWDIYSKKDYQGLLKVFFVSYLQLKIFLKLLFKEDAKIIYAINPVSGIVAFLISIFTSKNYLYESHEMIFGLNYPFFKGRWRFFWIPLEKLIISRSAKFITTDLYRMVFYRRYYKLPEEKIMYLLNVPSKLKMKDNNKLRRKFGFSNQFIISYCGGIIEGRNIEEIIKAFGAACDKIETPFLLLAGSVSETYKKVLINILKELGVNDDKYVFTGELKNNRLKEYMQISNVTFALYDKISLNNRMCSPNKIFDAIHLETPIICSDSFLSNYILKKNSAGNVISKTDSDNIKSALLKRYKMKDSQDVNFDILKNKYNWTNEYSKLKKNVFTN